jgi:hypothetical protein
MTPSLHHLDLLKVSSIVGLALPWVVAVLKQDTLSTRVNSIIAAWTCVLAAVLTCWAKHQLDASDMIGSVVSVYTVAVASYSGLWRHLGEPTLQSKTTIMRSPRP